MKYNLVTRVARPIRCVSAVFLGVFLAVTAWSAESAISKPAPLFTATSFMGSPVDLAALKGKVVYIDFWASWCRPCRQTLPWMNAIHDRYAQQGLVVLAINEDSEREAALKMLTEFSARFTAVPDPSGEIAALYSPPAMPSSFLVDKRGLIRAVFKGFVKADEEKIEGQIQYLLAEDF